MKKWGKEKALLLFTDTDSLTYQIETKDVYRDMLPDVEKRFDTSKGVNAGVIGDIFKDELSGKPITDFIGLAAKTYCIRTAEKCEKRNKGVLRGVVAEKIGFEHYEDCLKNNAIYYSHFVKISSHRYKVTTDLVKKEALSSYDDKRFLISDDSLHRTLAWYHKDIPESVREHCNQSGSAFSSLSLLKKYLKTKTIATITASPPPRTMAVRPTHPSPRCVLLLATTTSPLFFASSILILSSFLAMDICANLRSFAFCFSVLSFFVILVGCQS